MMNEVSVPVDSDQEEGDNNASANPSFDSVVQARLSRRQVLSGTAGAAAIAMLGGLKSETALASHPDFDNDFFKHRGPRLGFTAVPKSLAAALNRTIGQRSLSPEEEAVTSLRQHRSA